MSPCGKSFIYRPVVQRLEFTSATHSVRSFFILHLHILPGQRRPLHQQLSFQVTEHSRLAGAGKPPFRRAPR